MKELEMRTAVAVVKERGVKEAEPEFNWIFSRLLPEVERLSENYIREKNLHNLSIDPTDLIHEAMYKWLLRSISTYDETIGTFEGYFFKYIDQAFSNATSKYFAKKREIDTFPADSLDREIDDEGNIFGDQFANPEPEEDFSENMLTILEIFKEKKGEQAKQVVMCHAYYEGKEKTEMLCKIFGVDSYNSTIRKRVQRIMDDFTKLLTEMQ